MYCSCTPERSRFVVVSVVVSAGVVCSSEDIEVAAVVSAGVVATVVVSLVVVDAAVVAVVVVAVVSAGVVPQPTALRSVADAITPAAMRTKIFFMMHISFRDKIHTILL